MGAYRSDLRKHIRDDPRERAGTRDVPDTSSPDPATVLRNVILLHVRGWSVRAIAEDLDLARSTVQDMIGRWRKAPRILHPARQTDQVIRCGV
jgi:DNA-binding NarL/FixJ family response regulator